MLSNFAPQRPNPGATANPAVEETYGLAGLNLRDPDEIMPAGESPWTINSRMYARNDGESRVASRTRMGASYLSIPVGQALSTENIGSSTGDAPFTISYDTNQPPVGTPQILAFPWTAANAGALPQQDLNIKKDAGATGHIIVEIWTDISGFPGMMIAQGSILASNITTAYQYLSAYFIDAPSLVSGTQYWTIVYVQDNGSGNYYLSATAGSGAILSSDSMGSWTTLGYLINHKTYLATAGGVNGFHLRYPSDPTMNRIMLAQGGSLYAIPKGTGIPALVDSSLVVASNPVRFTQFDDKTIYVDGVSAVKWWDGTDPAAAIGGTVPVGPVSNVIVWQNRLFVVSNSTRVDFSDLSDPTSFTSVNFFYVPTPLSPDHIAGWMVFQNNLVIFTHNSKHIIIGSDISTFTRKEAVGTKGAVSQEAMDADRNFIYFMADDKQIYAFNGVTDTLLSEKVQPELTGISDVSKVSINVYRNQVRVYYPKSPSTTNNRCLIYDLELKQWFLDTDHPISGSAYLYLDDNELVEFSGLMGQVMYGETQFSDLGKKLDYRYWTNYKNYAYRRRNGQTFGGGSAKKRVKRFRPVLRVTNSDFNMLVGVDHDFANRPDMRQHLVSGGGAKWGAFVWGDGTIWGGIAQINTRSGVSGRADYIQYRFERLGVETPVELYGYIAQYKIGRQK